MTKDKRKIPLKDGEIIPIKFNYHFIRIFGENSNIDIVEYFISDYYNIPIEEVIGNIEILSRDLPQDSRKEKSKQIDLLLKLKNKKINIEISTSTSQGRKERDLVYLAKVHGEQLRYKDDYENIGYSWQIRLNDTKNNEKLIRKYYLTSDDEERKVYSKKFRIDEINLAAAKNIEYNEINEKLVRWCRIINAHSREEIVKELGDKLMNKSAREKLLEEVEKNSRDEEVYDIYEKYSTFEMEKRSEIHEAVEETTKRKNIETVRRMFKEGLSISIISKVTDLSTEEIEKLLDKKIKNGKDEEVYDIYDKHSTFEMEKKSEIQEAVEENTKKVTAKVTEEVTMKNAIETAKKMLEDKIGIELIIKYTGLSKEEIEKIK